MKTTLDLPDEVMRAIKVRAAQQDRKIKDVVTELLRRALSQPDDHVIPDRPRRVHLPLVQCGDPVGPLMTPQQVAAALLDEEAGQVAGCADAAV